MLHYSERNYGCRFLEVSLYGYRMIILENDKIRVSFLLDKGTEIIEFSYKKTDTDFVWRAPLGLSCIKKLQYLKKDEHVLTDGYTGGWFECFPNVGDPCQYKGALIPHYGELCYLPWEYSVVKDEPDEVILKCFVRTTKTPYFIEKIFLVKKHIPTLFIEENIKNLGNLDLEFQWGFHPNFGGNFIDENCVIDMKAGGIKVHYSAEGSRFHEGTEGEWPFINGKAGNMIDIRKVMPKHTGVNEVIDIYDLKEGRTTVNNVKSGLSLEMRWDVNVFKHNTIWHVCNGDTGYPRYGDTYVLGFLPRNDKVWCLENSVKNGNCPLIKSGETKKNWFMISVCQGDISFGTGNL